MTLSDKILIMLENYGTLSSEMVKMRLNKDHGIDKSKRQIQRLITELVKQKRVKPNSSVGRQQTYSILREKPSNISNFFLSKFWEELFEIRDKLFEQKTEDPLTDDPLVDTFDLFRKLRSLVKMLPKEIKEKIDIKFESFIELTADDRKKVEEKTGTLDILMVAGVPFGEEEWKRRQERKRILRGILKKRLEDIIGEVAMRLHEALREEAFDNE